MEEETEEQREEDSTEETSESEESEGQDKEESVENQEEEELTEETEEGEKKDSLTEEESSEEDRAEDQDRKELLEDEMSKENRAGMLSDFQSYQTPGLIDVELLNNTSLEASYNQRSDGVHEITLTYRGNSVLGLNLLSNIFSNFYLPSEIAEEITNESLSATYDVPLLLFIRNTGQFDSEDINHVDNHVYMNFASLLSVNLLSYYEFTLTIELDELPPTETGEYVFHSVTSSNLVDLSLISDDGTATATLTAPQLPDTPVLEEPIYTTDEEVRGTGEPNSTIIIRIDNQEYRGEVDGEGNFSVSIPSQQAGTEIHGVIESKEGYESDETSVTVIEPLEAPELEPVYSNDTVVTGIGIPNTTVILGIGDATYESDVDANGNFSVQIPEQAPGTLISAMVVDEDEGIKSRTTEVTVIEATVAFYNIPDRISFDTTPINPTLGTIRIPRQNPDWALEVIDNRGEGSEFQVLAEVTQPLSTADDSHALPNALVYVDEERESHSLYNNATEVYSG